MVHREIVWGKVNVLEDTMKEYERKREREKERERERERERS